jgi:low affinity Fe/Cu permease
VLKTNFPQWWQITVYSAGALISVLMLFLIQHTTNRHTNAILVKLDELIKATSGARNEVIGIEDQQLDEQDELSNELSDATVLEKGGQNAPQPKESRNGDGAIEPSASAHDCPVPAARNSS